MVDDPESVQLMIVGASVRAAAQSAQAAGLHVTLATDMFGDQDLVSCVANYVPLEAGYRNFFNVLQKHSVEKSGLTGWLYTGAMENYPELVGAGPIRLLGNSAAVLARIRDPWRLADSLLQAGLPMAKLSRIHAQRDVALRWLRKPFKSAAGLGIELMPAHSDRVAKVGPMLESSTTETHYFQEMISGRSFGALYLAAGGDCALIGVARQFIGPEFGTPGQFQYAGSIGPVPLSPDDHRQWLLIGRQLAADFGLTGLFGVDAILSGDLLYVVEVNPRYTAAAEVFERVLGVPVVRVHVDACLTGVLPDLHIAVNGLWAGKRVVYATRAVHVSDVVQDVMSSPSVASYQFADLPKTGSKIPAGAPIATVLAGPLPSEADVGRALTEGIHVLESLFD